jgi:hypothetical protein
MSVALMSKVFGTRFDWGSEAPAEPTIKLVMLALADHASDTGEAVYPSITHICSKTGLSRRAVINVISAARTKGAIVAIGRRKQVIEYRMVIDQCTTCTSAPGAPVPVHHVHRTSAPRAHVTINEPSSEPSMGDKPKSAPKPKAPSAANSNDQSKMIGSLMRVTGSVTGARVARQASDLIRAGFDPEHIEREYSQGGWWYANDWRGKKGQPPTAEQIIATAGQTKARANGNRQTGRNKYNADPNEITPDMTEEESTEVWNRMMPEHMRIKPKTSGAKA